MTQGIARRSLVLGGALAPAAWLALPGVAHAGGQIEEPLMDSVRTALDVRTSARDRKSVV